MKQFWPMLKGEREDKSLLEKRESEERIRQ
jgi:hypothetical protein